MQAKTQKTTFVAAASGMENVSVSEMLQAKIDQRNQSLNLQSVFTSAKAINNISTMHCFQVPERVN